MSTLSMEAERS